MQFAKQQEEIIENLREDCFRMQEEVQKALKIHKANKVLQEKQAVLKKEIDRLKRDHQKETEELSLRIRTQQE